MSSFRCESIAEAAGLTVMGENGTFPKQVQNIAQGKRERSCVLCHVICFGKAVQLI